MSGTNEFVILVPCFHKRLDTRRSLAVGFPFQEGAERVRRERESAGRVGISPATQNRFNVPCFQVAGSPT
jgi:hypothetical protein